MPEDARTDGGTATKQGGRIDQPSTDDRTETERARDAAEEFVAEHVQESRYANASLIAKQVSVDVRPQAISHAIGEALTGDAPEGFLEDVRVGRWSEASPVTWSFNRIGGEPAPERVVDRRRKVEIVQEISEATGAEGAEKYTGGDTRTYTKISCPRTWKQDVIDAVCELTGVDPELGDEDDEHDRDRREQLAGLSCKECSAVLERVLDEVTVTGNRDHWNKETCATIHEVVVGDGGEDGE